MIDEPLEQKIRDNHWAIKASLEDSLAAIGAIRAGLEDRVVDSLGVILWNSLRDNLWDSTRHPHDRRASL